MTGYGFFSALRFVLGLGLIALAGLAGFVGILYSELSKLASFRQRYGVGWEGEYEKYVGTVAAAHTRITLSAFGIVAILVLMIWIYKLIRTNPGQAKPGTKHRRQRAVSTAERTVRYKGKALVRVYFGLAGIVAAVVLVVFDWGMFRDHDDEISLAIFVFIAGYGGVLSGCRWWLKAKAWNEAIIFIGLMPLVILFIPFVRLIFLSSPLILPAMMVMMPIILVVVVSVLPDQSDTSRSRLSWSRTDEPKDR